MKKAPSRELAPGVSTHIDHLHAGRTDLQKTDLNVCLHVVKICPERSVLYQSVCFRSVGSSQRKVHAGATQTDTPTTRSHADTCTHMNTKPANSLSGPTADTRLSRGPPTVVGGGLWLQDTHTNSSSHPATEAATYHARTNQSLAHTPASGPVVQSVDTAHHQHSRHPRVRQRQADEPSKGSACACWQQNLCWQHETQRPAQSSHRPLWGTTAADQSPWQPPAAVNEVQ